MTTTLGVIFGNRDFFPDHLVTSARAEMTETLASLDVAGVSLGEADSKLGGVETHEDARKCAELFRRRADEIDGVIVSLPNFGDEKGVADTLKLAGLNVPVLVQAYPDDLGRLDAANRRDAYCGKISVCNNLVQYGIPFTLTEKHTVHPADECFREDLRRFAAICRVVRGMRTARIGAIGARPGALSSTTTRSRSPVGSERCATRSRSRRSSWPSVGRCARPTVTMSPCFPICSQAFPSERESRA